MLGNDSLGQFSLSEIDPPVTYVLSTSVGTLTLTGLSDTLADVEPAVAGTLRLVGLSADLLWLFGGTDGANKKRHGKANIRPLPRKVTVTDRDGQVRQVGYLTRYAPPPPVMIEIPAWALPPAPREERADATSAAPPLLPPELPPLEIPAHLAALRDLQDESDLLDVLARQSDPLAEDIIAVLSVLQAAGALDQPTGLRHG